VSKILANLAIRKKFALLIANSVGPIVCLGVLSLIALNALSNAVDRVQTENAKMLSAERAAIGLERVNSIVGHITLSRQCTLCHADAAGGGSNLEALARDSASLLHELTTHESSPDGQKLLTEFEKAGSEWLDTNRKVLNVQKTGSAAQAATLYKEESLPQIGPVDNALKDYLTWQQPRLDEQAGRAAALKRSIRVPVVVLTLLALVAAASLGRKICSSIGKPLSAAIKHVEAVAEGDVTRDVDREYLERADEIGLLSKSMQAMSTNLRAVLGDVTRGIQVLSASSAQLSATSGQMSDGAHEVSDKAHSVATAAEQMTANVVSVATGMEQTTTNLSSVASATGEMTSTIGEIAGNSEKARHITEDAARQAARISEQMNELGRAAREIGKVTETITEISSQTNLLALNATIEAARAGTAGKGFAVVASEIKELAQQTSAATEDIKSKVAGVQSSTSAGISEIEKVAQVIREVNDIVCSIAAAIEEQATVAKDIARNVDEASKGVRDANHRVSESSQTTQEIAREVVDVDHAARQMAEGSEQARASAGELSGLAEQLQLTVARFRV